MPSPIVSIVVPSFNHGAYLGACIESVLAQTFGDWELVVVDDTSSDDSLAVARTFDDPRIRLLSNPTNLGTYATQNRGIDESRGEWIAILNSDDVWSPTKLERQLDAFSQHSDAAFGYTRGRILDGELEGEDPHRDYPTTARHDLRRHLLAANQVLASSVMFRRGAVRFEESFRYCGDWLALWRLSGRGPAVFVDEPLTLWRHHPGNSFARLEQVLPEEIRVRVGLLAHPAEAGWGHKRAECALNLAALWILAGRSQEARIACSVAMFEGSARTKNTAARRLLASLMPREQALKRLWPGCDPNVFAEIGRRGDLTKPFDPPL